MKIRFLATGIAPEDYRFDGEKIWFGDEWYDLSDIEEGDIFEGVEGDVQGIRAVERINGELYVTLCQKAPPGHWTGKDMEYIDSKDYDPSNLYIRPKAEDEIKEGYAWGS